MKWFAAIYLLSESKKGMSALQLKRTLRTSYKTAWFLCHRIREAVKDDACELLNGIIECDETYIGGKAKFMHESRKAKFKRGKAGLNNKTVVLGAIQRGGKVRLEKGVTGTAATRDELHAFIKARIAEEAKAIFTDENSGYQGIGDDNTIHVTVDHGDKQWIRGIADTNTLENVWSLFKRSIVGSYHQVSVKHLDWYLDEFEFRFNNRHNPYLFRDTLLRLLTSTNIDYKTSSRMKMPHRRFSMPTFNIYPKEGEMFPLTFPRFELTGSGQGFWVYDDAYKLSHEGLLAFENIAAIIPAIQREDGMLRFNVYLKHKEPFPVFANAFEEAGERIVFKYQDRDLIGRNIISEWPVEDVYVAAPEVVAIMPSDGLISYRR